MISIPIAILWRSGGRSLPHDPGRGNTGLNRLWIKLKIIGFLVLMAIKHLNIVVEVGLVTGVTRR